MFEDRTTERIKAEALAKINQATGLSPMEGGFADAMIGPAAEEISKLYKALPAVASMLFVDESSGPYLDAVGQNYFNITRKEGTYAYCDVSLTGEAGTVLPAGTAFLTSGGLEFTLVEDVVIGSTGTATGRLRAAGTGSAYNVEAGAVTRMYVNPLGLSSFENGEASGGTDVESDSALYRRIDERRKRPPTSGNGYQLRQWAMEVPGVGEAKVVELAGGRGTVSVTLVDANGKAASAELVSAATAYIEARRVVGSTVSVASAAELEVSVSAAVQLTAATTAAAVRLELQEKLEAYRRELISEKFRQVYYRPEEDGAYTLIYNRVAALLLTIPGVVNYTALTVNGKTEDVSIPAGSVPVLGEVRIQ